MSAHDAHEGIGNGRLFSSFCFLHSFPVRTSACVRFITVHVEVSVLTRGKALSLDQNRLGSSTAAQCRLLPFLLSVNSAVTGPKWRRLAKYQCPDPISSEGLQHMRAPWCQTPSRPPAMAQRERKVRVSHTHNKPLLTCRASWCAI